MKGADYDAKALGASLRHKLREVQLSALSKEEINSVRNPFCFRLTPNCSHASDRP